MKHTNSVFKKALSVFLCAVMMLSVISVGIIVPEPKADALTVGQTISVNSVSALNSAIATANSAGANTITTIKLSTNLDIDGNTAACTSITGYVKFDFNGCYINFTKTVNLSENESDNYQAQLPSGLQSSGGVKDTMTQGILNVSSGGTLQLVNTSSTASTLKVWAKVNCDDGNGSFFWSRSKKTTHTASASAIYSEGNVILGDSDNSGYSNFTVWAQSISSDDEDGYIRRNAICNTACVTMNSSSGTFKMYGGTLKGLACCRSNYSGSNDARCFPLNINNCYSSEIYGGTINIPGNDECGVRNSDGNASDGGTCYFASIRVNSANVYIFNVDSLVDIYVGDDTDKVNTSAANIYVPNTSALPCVYGGKFNNDSSGVDKSSAGWDHNYTILGKFSYADGTMKPGTDKSTTVNGTNGWQYVYRNPTPIQYFYTMFYCADGSTENGVYPWNYATFRDYLAARTSSNDIYFNASTYTRINDGTSYAVDTNYKYRRNGYAYSAWTGSKMAGATGSTTYANSGACGFNASAGGSIFLFPKWVENTYTITYDLNDTVGNNRASNASGAPTTYKITSTSALPTPTRAGYAFGGWLLDSKSVPATDTVTDAWMQGSTYPAGTSLTGKNGSINLKAVWTEVPYTVTFDYDNIPAGASGTKTTTTANYNVNSTFTFPTGCTKDYYTFNNTWKVTTAAGSFAAGNTYGAGNTSANASYGSATFTAQYTPIDYTITFDSDFGALVENITYNYESTATLPATTRLGYTFAGWKPEELSASGLWDPAVAYPAGTSLNHKHDNITLKAQWESVASKVNLSLGTGEIIAGSTQLDYAYSSPLQLNNPTKTGYKFKGWKVTQIPGSYTSDIPAANRWVIDHEYLLGSDANVTLPANMIGDVTLTPIWEAIQYTITYNTNGGTACANTSYNITSSVSLASTAKNGYTFTGWSVTSHDDVYNWTAATYAAGGARTGMYGNITLTANWTANAYTVTLDVNGGDALTDNTLAYNIEGATALPQPTRTGYDFLGWKLTSCDTQSDWATYTGKPADDIYTDALPQGHFGSLTLTAQWAHKQYTITLNTAGSNNGTKTYYIDSASFTLGASALPGYSFKNWKVNADAGNWTKDETYLATAAIVNKYGNVTLTAQFEPVSYTITYKNEHGEQIGAAVSYTIEDTVSLNSYSVAGYTFDGWKVVSVTAGGGWMADSVLAAEELGANMYYGNVVLEPVLTPVEYKLTFVSDGGTTYPQKTYTIETDDYTLPAPTKNGYDFAGWKVTAAAGSWTENAVFAAGTSVTGKYGSATLTATWTPKQYLIKYIVGNTTLYPDGITKQGTFGQTAPDLTDAEKAKPADAQYSYTFDHWDPALTTVTGETTYTAGYTKTLRSYDITWMLPDDAGGTLGNYTAQTTPNVNYGDTPVFNNGVNPTLTSDFPDEYSWRFAGWSTTAGGTVLESVPAVTGTATYYAVFTKVLAPEEVNWVINGVTNTELWGIGETPEWKHDTPSKPDANGYKFTFTGWAPSIVPVEQGSTYTYTAQFASELQTYTCTLALAGGTYEGALEGTYKMGDTITFPAPEKTGYTFAGWKLDAAVGTWAADTTVNAGDFVTNTLWGSVSFTAQWTPATYTITYNKASAEDVVPAAQNYNIESAETLGTAEREGYTLSGWVVATASGNWTQGANLAASTVLTGFYGNVTLTPVWQVNTYTITWISGDAEQTSEVEYGSAIVAFPPSSRMGYTADWDAEVPATMPAADLTFTAVYTPVEYYVRVNVNGGSEVENFYYTINGDNTLPTPTRDGATFAGWKVTAAAGNWSGNAIMNGGASLNGKYGNVSLTAQWNMRTCTVIWNAGDTVKTTVWYYGSTPSFDGTPYKSPDEENSYVFAGWDKEIVPVTEDEVTYTALFTPTERVYTVIWNIDGANTTQYYHYGDTPVYEGATPVRPETSEYIFTFTGWSPEVSTVTKDVTYTAQFGTFTKIQGLSLDVSSMFMEIEDTAALHANIYPANATVKDVVWSSSDPSVAAIDAAGNITAVKNGVAVIKVASVDGAFNSYCVVTVNARITNYVQISAGNISTTQLPGTSIQLSAVVMPDNATDTSIVWTSSDNNVAMVDANGLVTFKTVGSATITAKAKDGFAVGSIDVVTASDETEVEDAGKTYLVSFASVSGGFILLADGKETAPITDVCLKMEEGTDIVFKLVNKGFYPLVNGVSYGKPGEDGWYRISSLSKNMAIVDEIVPIGIDVIDPDKEENNAPSFWQRVQNFFKMIVNFFRNLFK